MDDDDVDISDELSNMERLLSKEPREIGDSAPEISTEPDEDDDEKKTHAEKKRERGEIFKALQAQRDETVRTQEQLRAIQQQNQSLQQQLQQRPQQQGVSPRARLDNLYDQMEQLERAYAGEVASNGGKEDPDTQREYKRRYHLMQEEKFLIMRQATESQPPDSTQTAYEVIQRQNAARNPDIYGNQRHLKWASARYQLLAEEYQDDQGRPTVDAEQLHDHVMKEARKKFGLTRSSVSEEPSRASRRRHSSTAGGTGASQPKRSIRMIPEFQAMADAAYSHIEDRAERHKAWARGPGAELVKSKER